MPGKEYQMSFQIGAKLQNQFGSAFRAAQTSVTALQGTIESLNRRQGDIAAYQKQQAAVEATRAKLTMLQQQYENLKKEMGENGEASATLQNQMLQKEMQITKTTAALESQEKKLDTMGTALTEAGVDTKNLTTESKNLSTELESLKARQEQAAEAAGDMQQSLADAASAALELAAAVGATKALKEGYEVMKQCADASIEFESSMAGVKRTVGGSDKFLAELGENFKSLSTDIPITTDELTAIATTAGQLGIVQSRVESFTTVMAMLATTTDLTADSAATMLAQFANITGLTEYDRLGSVVAELGDATATTASKVVEMSQGMAASASQAGMSSVDIMAIAAAVGSLGIEAQAGSTAMSTLISTLYKAVETGDGLADFASIANMSAEQFKTAWGSDAVGAMNAFIQGLNDTERNGRSAIVVLDELGITNVRQTKAILGLASAGDLLSNTITQANNAWNENTALSAKASVMYETTEAKLTMASNAANNLKIAIGDALTPAIGTGAEMFNDFLEPVTRFVAANPALVRAVTASVAVFGVATVAITGYTTVTKLATKANALFAASIPGLNIILGVTAGIAVLAGAFVGLSGVINDSRKSMEELDEEYDDLTDQLRQQRHIQSLCEEYRTLSSELDSIRENGVADLELSATLEKHGFDSMDDVRLIQEMASSIETKRGELKQILELAGAEDITDKDIDKIVDFGGALQNEEGTLKQTLELLGIEDISDEDLETISNLSAEIATKEGTLSETLALHGFENYDDLVQACNLADDVEAANKAAEIVVQAKAEGFDDVDGKIASLSTNVQETASALADAKLSLGEMETRYGQLEARLSHAKSDDEKSAIQTEMEALNTTISEQEAEVEGLEATYQSYSQELLTTQAAADYLTESERRLAAIKAELAESTDGMITATEEETDVLLGQVEAAEALAKAKQSELRQQVSTNIQAQAQQYANSLYTAAVNQQALNDATARYDRMAEWSLDGPEALKATMEDVFNSMVSMAEAGAGIGDVDFSNAIQQAEDLMYLATGMQYDYSGNWLLFQYDMDRVTTSWTTMQAAEADAAWYVREYQNAVNEAEGVQNAFLENLVNGVREGGMSLEEVEGILSEAFATTYNGAAIVEAVMEELRNELDATADSADNMADGLDGTKASAEDLNAAIAPILTQMEELGAAYTEAYNVAYDSMNGQFELFEQAPEITTTSVDDMIAALESQAAYMQTYSENLKAAAEMGLSDGLLAQLSDGSVESAAYLQSIVSDGATKIDELNTAFAGVEDGKATFADTVAEMQTDFSTKMAELQTELETTVSNMDMSADAATAGQTTVQAFADAATNMLPTVRSAYASVAAAAASALNVSVTGTGSVGGYAVGTESAERGFAYVGENGPELVWFNGGERVFTASETAELMENRAIEAEPVSAFSGTHEGTTYTVEIRPEFNISGSADNAELRAMLDEYAASLKGLVEDALADIESDRERSVYS